MDQAAQENLGEAWTFFIMVLTRCDEEQQQQTCQSGHGSVANEHLALRGLSSGSHPHTV